MSLDAQTELACRLFMKRIASSYEVAGAIV